MLNIGFGELILIVGIALVVIGPEKFPEFAKIAIRAVRDLRGYLDDVKAELHKELQPIKSELDDLSRYKPEDYIDALASGNDEDEKKPEDAQGAIGASPQSSEGQGSAASVPPAENVVAEQAEAAEAQPAPPETPRPLDAPSQPERLDG